MLVKISIKDLLETFALADSGAKATVRKVDRSKTERTPALLTFAARCDRGGSLMISTSGEFPSAAITTSAVVEAVVREEGVHTCDLEDARARFGQLKKTAKRGMWAELYADDASDCILVKTDKATVRIPRDPDSRVETLADVPPVTVVPASDIRAALELSKGMRPGTDGALMGHVVSFGHGIVVAWDERNAEILSVPAITPDASPVHVPRQALAVLARSGGSVHIGDGYASCGRVQVSWRLIGNGTQADMMFDFLRKLAHGRPATTTFDGAELRQALASLTAFLTKGDVIRLLPSECGARILRYDVRDDSDLASADRAEVLVGALWPLPCAITLPASRLKRVLGNADVVDLCLGEEPGDPVAARVHGDPVAHIMCQCPCPFEGVDTI